MDSLGIFELIDWDTLLDRSRATRALDARRRAALQCVNARQIAAVEGIELVLCGSITPTVDGFLVELTLYPIGSAEWVRLPDMLAPDQESAVQQILRELAEWGLNNPA